MSASRYASVRGLTLLELLVTIPILAVLLAVGLPSRRDFIVSNRLSSDVNASSAW